MDEQDLVDHRFSRDEWVLLSYAAKDSIRLYRRLRRDIQNGTYHLLTEEQATAKMNEYKDLVKLLESIYCP